MTEYIVIGALLLALGVFLWRRERAKDWKPHPKGWRIGPVIHGKNYSVGMPAEPHPVLAIGEPSTRGAVGFDFPQPDQAAGHIHYMTRDLSLAGASGLHLRYRIEADTGVRFLPKDFPQLQGTLSLVLQRAGDDWSAKGEFETYRWYLPLGPVREGSFDRVIPLGPGWSAVEASTYDSNPRAFRAARDNTDNVGLVFGGGDGLGHGLYATGRATFTLLELRAV